VPKDDAARKAWWRRKVLAWRLSNTMDVDFCVEALEAALARHGKPEIFNTDSRQPVHLPGLHAGPEGRRRENLHGWQGALDGQSCFAPARAVDMVGLIERPWRSLKYECVYLQAFETGSEARAGIGWRIDYYNTSRPHSAFDGRTPEEVYSGRDASSPGHAPEMTPEALAP
jgi:putative transposase